MAADTKAIPNTMMTLDADMGSVSRTGSQWNDDGQIEDGTLSGCAVQSLQEACRITSGGCYVENGMQSKLETCRMTSMGADTFPEDDHLPGQLCGTFSLDKVLQSLFMGGISMFWEEVQHFTPAQLIGDQWERFVRKKGIMLDFVLQRWLEELCNNSKHDNSIELKIMATHGLYNVLKMMCDEVQLRYFARYHGLEYEGKHAEAMNEKATCNSKSDAQGSAEEASLDVAAGAQVDAYDKKQSEQMNLEERKKTGDDTWMLDTTGELHHQCRGGMNRYQCLANESEEEDDVQEPAVASTSYKWLTPEEEIAMQERFSEEMESIPGSENGADSDSRQDDGALEASFCSNNSGRSFYKEFYDKKLQCRGGALGSSTTKSKQLTEALKALSKVVTAMEPTQQEGAEQEADQETKELIREPAKSARRWEQNIPPRKELQEHLQKFLFMLENQGKSTSSSSGLSNRGASQSFYGQFQSKLKEDGTNFADKFLQSKDQPKGKGKGKGKSKAASKADDLPRFDLKRSFPAKEIVPWQLVSKQLEQGRFTTRRSDNRGWASAHA